MGSDDLHTLLHYPDHAVAKHCASCPHEERCWNLTFVPWTTLSLLTTVPINLVNHIRLDSTFQTCDIEQAKRFGSCTLKLAEGSSMGTSDHSLRHPRLGSRR
jgi:hypothetical protein